MASRANTDVVCEHLPFERGYRDKRILLTGHTGFKGCWLALWLAKLGAHVTGLSLPPELGRRSLYEEADIASFLESRIGDIRDPSVVAKAYSVARPEIVFHLAAQALVRRSYSDPVDTFSTNVMGTANVLEAAVHHPSVRAVVCITSDKVYDNKEWSRGFREDDPLGGKDPYSASKAAAEMVARSYATTIYPRDGRIRLATARGGNVVGGGDWSEDRIVVDLVQAIESSNAITLRNPTAVRPWQHVLELCRGYMMLGQRLLDGDDAAAGAWNFGPARENEVTVQALTEAFLKSYGSAGTKIVVEPSNLPEAQFLRLDSTKAGDSLGWHPRLGLSETITWTAHWYRKVRKDTDAPRALMLQQIENYRALCAQA